MQLYTLKEMAGLYKRSARTFRKYVKDLKIPHTKLGNAFLFDPQKVALYLESVESTNKPTKTRSRRSVPAVTKYQEMLGL